MVFALYLIVTSIEMCMNTLNHTSLIKKLAVLVAVTGVSGSISLPVLAQVNPHPSIFNEPPYNHSYSPRPRHRPKHRPKHRPGPLLGQEPADGGPPPAQRPGDQPGYGPQGGEPPTGGPPPVPPAGTPPG